MLRKLNRRKKGQSTLEYIILVAGVIAILIVFLGEGGVMQSELNSTLVDGTNAMDIMSDRLVGSYGEGD